MRNRRSPRRGDRIASPVSILCLGSSAALTNGGPWSSLLIDGRILLEIPPTTVPELYRHGLDLARIDCVFISHFHADHTFGLPFLLLEYRLRHPRATALTLVGPPGLERFVETLCDMAWPDLRAGGHGLRVPLAFVEVEAERETTIGDMRFVAVPVEHFDLAAFGYRIVYRGRTIAYTGDTGPCAALESLLEGADVAILELTHPRPTEDRGHLDAQEVAQLIAPLVARGATVLATHMTETPRPIAGVTFCEPGKTYRV